MLTLQGKPLDVKFDDALTQALSGAQKGDTSELDQLIPQVETDKDAVAVRADGNSVDVDQEMAFLSENNIRYNALIQIASKKMSTLKYVISDGRR